MFAALLKLTASLLSVMSLAAALLHGLLLHVGTIDMLCCAGGGGGGEGAGGNGGSSGSGSTSLVGDKQNDKKKLAPVSITLVSFAVSRKAYTKVHVQSSYSKQLSLSPNHIRDASDSLFTEPTVT